jgi:DNA (cytosine-5)-methyltransferase 1
MPVTQTLARVYQDEIDALGKRASQFRPNPELRPKPVPGKLIALDMFSGTGGFSTALMRSARKNGFKVELSMINHWSLALDNARANLGDVRVFNSGVEELDPAEVVPGRYLDILLASPECVMFSSARGARPIVDQRRSTAAEILRYLEDIWVETVVLENVSEVVQWGPLDEHHRPIASQRGTYFKAVVKAIKRLGYNVEYRTIVAANHGDPTTRKRWYCICQRKRKVSFPQQTHSKNASVPGTKSWVPARKIINFAIKGLSIFSRQTPHVVKTLRRILIGFETQVERAPLAAAYVEAVKRFKDVTELYYKQIEPLPTKKSLGRNLTKDEQAHVKAVKTAAQQQHRFLVEEIFRTPVAVFEWDDILLRDGVEPSLEGERRVLLGTMQPVDPIVTKLFGTTNTTDVNEPLDTIKAGGTTYGIARPVPDAFVVTPNHGDSGDTSARHSEISDPLQTITAKNPFGVVSPEFDAVEAGVEPYLLRANASDTSAWDDSISPISHPAKTVTTKNNFSLVAPQLEHVQMPDVTILPQHTYDRDTVADPDEPLPTVTTISRHGVVEGTIEAIEPFVDSYYGPKGERDRAPRSVSQPLATQPTANRFGLVEPAVINMKGKSNASDIDAPAPTITAHAQHLAIAEPVICSRNSQHHAEENRTHTLDEPALTATTRGAGYFVEPTVEPILVSQNYGFDNNNPNLDEPLVSLSTRGAGYIAEPVVQPVDPVIIPQHRGIDCDPVDRPIRALATKNGTGFADPVMVTIPDGFTTPNFGENAGQRPRTHSLDEPVPTATSHGAGMLVQPDLEQLVPGKPYVLVSGNVFSLDVLYRMLEKEELARAHSLITETETFTFGNVPSSAAVKMIGNGVAVETAIGLIDTAMAYRYEAEAAQLTGIAV